MKGSQRWLLPLLSGLYKNLATWSKINNDKKHLSINSNASYDEGILIVIC